jgi:hypothetical protein
MPGFHCKVNQVITRGRTSYLRYVGDPPTFILMTATANEPDESFLVFQDRERLVTAALQLHWELNAISIQKRDSGNRKFVRICEVTFEPGTENEDNEKLNKIVERFFEIFDNETY